LYNIQEREILKNLIDEGVDFSKITKVTKTKNINNKMEVMEITIDNNILFISLIKNKNKNKCRISYKKNEGRFENIGDIVNLYIYLFNFDINVANTEKDKEFYQEIRIAKGLMTPEDYKYGKNEKKLLKKIAMMKIIKSLWNKIFNDGGEIIVSLISFTGVITILFTLIYQNFVIDRHIIIYYFDNLNVLNNVTFYITLLVFIIYVYNIDRGESDFFTTLFIAMILNIISYSIISLFISNFDRNLTPYTMTNLLKEKEFKELDKLLKENINIQYDLTKEMKELLLKIYNSDESKIEKISIMIQNTNGISKKDLLGVFSYIIEDIIEDVKKEEKEKEEEKILNRKIERITIENIKNIELINTVNENNISFESIEESIEDSNELKLNQIEELKLLMKEMKIEVKLLNKKMERINIKIESFK